MFHSIVCMKKILLSKEIFADFTWGHRKRECFLICILYNNTQYNVKCDIMEKSQLLSGIPGNIEQILI